MAALGDRPLAGSNVYVIVAGKLYADPDSSAPIAVDRGQFAIRLDARPNSGRPGPPVFRCFGHRDELRQAAIPSDVRLPANSTTFDPTAMQGLYEDWEAASALGSVPGEPRRGHGQVKTSPSEPEIGSRLRPRNVSDLTEPFARPVRGANGSIDRREVSNPDTGALGREYNRVAAVVTGRIHTKERDTLTHLADRKQSCLHRKSASSRSRQPPSQAE